MNKENLKTNKEEQEGTKEERKISEHKITLDTMTKVGKKVILANREYLIAPINIGDMWIITSDILLLPILREKEIEDKYYMLNVIEEERAKYFFKIIEKYVSYNNGTIPMTRELVEEHNWSFKDIKKFLDVWLEVSD